MRLTSVPDCKYDNSKISLAKVKNTPTVKLARGTFTILDLKFSYANSPSGQSLAGWYIDMEFGKGVMQAFNVRKVNQISGYIWVEHTRSKIQRLIPLRTEEGEEFDVQKWADNTKVE